MFGIQGLQEAVEAISAGNQAEMQMHAEVRQGEIGVKDEKIIVADARSEGEDAFNPGHHGGNGRSPVEGYMAVESQPVGVGQDIGQFGEGREFKLANTPMQPMLMQDRTDQS